MPRGRRRFAWFFLAALAVASPAGVAAQEQAVPPPDTAAADTSKPLSVRATPRPTQLEFSGVIFANYQYSLERGPTRGANEFNVDRVYLTFRMPAGERASVRFTADLFQQQSSGPDAFYKGWVLRAKYAYLQYDYLKRGSATGIARIGLIHNVFIDHDESFWPRWIGTVATDRHGYFSSADAGLVTLVTLPRRRGELYLTLVNGTGFTSREIDRFKDFGARLTLTPFGNSPSSTWRTLALTGWAYEGAVASRFAAGGAGQIAPIGSSLQRDRWGLFAGLRHPRLTAAVQYAARNDESESGDNTAALPRSLFDSAGRLISAYGMTRVAGDSARRMKPLHLVARVDQVTTDRSRGDRHHLVIGGVVYDFTKAASVALDFQGLMPRRGYAVAPSKTLSLRLVAQF